MNGAFYLRRSLMLRMLVAMAAIACLALVSLLGSIVIAQSAGGYADAINQAGSLRMQAYRLLSTSELLPADHPRRRWQQEQMEATLASPAIVSLIPGDVDDPLRDAYDRVVECWHENLRPNIHAFDGGNAFRLDDQVAEFVDKVDILVGSLQKYAESKVVFLEVFQGVSLTILVVFMVMVVYRIVCGVMPPFRDLIRVVNGVMVGDFSGRTTYRGNDELGLLSRTINKMNASLSEMYGQLEKRVAAKTHELKRSNDALRMLYLTARRLNGVTPLTREELEDVLRQLEAVTDEGPFELRLTTGGAGKEMIRLVPRPAAHHQAEAATARSESGSRMTSSPSPGSGNEYAVRVREAGRDFGELRVQQPPGHMLAQWKIELVETVAGLIAAALSLSEKSDEQRRLALMDERAVIARELHDSLAQSLSYLKIQVTRLQMQLDQQRHEQVAQVVAELRHGLNSSYRQLRELLNTFRLRIHEAGLEAALDETVQEYSKRGDFELTLKGQWSGLALTPNEEIHVLQIVREALSNVARHARARHCTVSLAAEETGHYQLSIKDDGVGIGPQSDPSISHGMAIMEERARSLSGKLSVNGIKPCGTVVTVRFLPRLLVQLPVAVS
ncbi:MULTISPECIES: histidine kinase [Halomonas]|uniref:histidine kinase n=1 Tax=Halomonas TaxID=2745 RepID=UPI001C97C7FB|nr:MULTISPECIES: histidine kinase [Halomonas]MBY6209201.1 type IV pili methyl-accepting chemotaxis transducer N-terminal domain-containing protein [Halomonas sp. DP3Y7-2]MBY6229356.1 type IV pili methyl-accepting chemotaxis transducer N-terminal domain-containing protein [Halomonas sp. DP3Y7-1]MCA0917581.1 histidine kinase [Halomonas denitrificans]